MLWKDGEERFRSKYGMRKEFKAQTNTVYRRKEEDTKRRGNVGEEEKIQQMIIGIERGILREMRKREDEGGFLLLVHPLPPQRGRQTPSHLVPQSHGNSQTKNKRMQDAIAFPGKQEENRNSVGFGTNSAF